MYLNDKPETELSGIEQHCLFMIKKSDTTRWLPIQRARAIIATDPEESSVPAILLKSGDVQSLVQETERVAREVSKSHDKFIHSLKQAMPTFKEIPRKSLRPANNMSNRYRRNIFSGNNTKISFTFLNSLKVLAAAQKKENEIQQRDLSAILEEPGN